MKPPDKNTESVLAPQIRDTIRMFGGYFQMYDDSIKRIILGCAFALVGLVLIVFHDQLRRIGDAIRKRDPLLRWGDWWTGEYTRGGLIASRVISILFGIFFLVEGILIIAHIVD